MSLDLFALTYFRSHISCMFLGYRKYVFAFIKQTKRGDRKFCDSFLRPGTYGSSYFVLAWKGIVRSLKYIVPHDVTSVSPSPELEGLYLFVGVVLEMLHLLIIGDVPFVCIELYPHL